MSATPVITVTELGAVEINDDVIKGYLGDVEWSDDEIEAAIRSEADAQRAVTRWPVSVPGMVWPADLAEALCRRVAHNLAVRGLPLGVQAQISDMGATSYRVGGTDAEVRRLEAPFRRLVVA